MPILCSLFHSLLLVNMVNDNKGPLLVVELGGSTQLARILTDQGKTWLIDQLSILPRSQLSGIRKQG